MTGRDELSYLIAAAARLLAGGIEARETRWDPPRRTPRPPRRRRRAAIGMVGLAAGSSVLITWVMLRFDLVGALARLLAEPLRALLGPLAPGLVTGTIWAVWLAALFGLVWALRRRIRRLR